MGSLNGCAKLAGCTGSGSVGRFDGPVRPGRPDAPRWPGGPGGPWSGSGATGFSCGGYGAQLRGHLGGDGQDVSWRQGGVEPNVVGPPPLVGMPGQLVGDNELRSVIHAQRGHVEPDCRLAWGVRIKVYDGQDGVLTLAALGEADQFRLVDVMEA